MSVRWRNGPSNNPQKIKAHFKHNIQLGYRDYAMEKAKKEVQQRKVRQTCYDIVVADPTNVISVRRANCRWCWGANYEYQRTDWELDRDLQRFMSSAIVQKKRLIFNQMGGGGFVKTRDPNPACPICQGEGEEYARIADFRELSNRDRQLIQSVKVGKGGEVEVKFHDKIAAINTFAKIDGMITERRVVRVIEATEDDLNQYFKQDGIVIDHNDPDLLPFIEKAKEIQDNLEDDMPIKEAAE